MAAQARSHMNKPDERITIVAAERGVADKAWWRKALLWIVLAALLAAAAAYRMVGARRPVYTVARSELIQTIAASGRVKTPLRVDIGSQTTGIVASIPVAEGQAVRRGQLLIALDDGEARAAAEQARAAVNQAQARLVQLRQVGWPVALQMVRQAEVNLQNARRQYERSARLHSQGFIGQSQLDDAQRNLDLAESQLRAARLQAQSNSPEGSDYLLAKAALDQAQASLRMALAKLDYSTIEAPVDGTLIARDVERGDVVQPGKPLMVLSPAGQAQLVVQMDERNLAALRIGQKALASADAYPDQRFPAELVYINPAVDPQRGSVEVKFDVLDAPAYLRQDMTVSVDIEVARSPNALVVPIDAVHEIDSRAPWVLKLDKAHASRQIVKPGMRGAGKVEIVQGLQAGDQVIVGTEVKEGQRIRAVPAGRKAIS